MFLRSTYGISLCRMTVFAPTATYGIEVVLRRGWGRLLVAVGLFVLKA